MMSQSFPVAMSYDTECPINKGCGVEGGGGLLLESYWFQLGGWKGLRGTLTI